MHYRGDNDWLDYQALQHWKYIYKKKINGKWRYYYDIGKPGVNVAGGSNKPDGPNSNIKSYSKFEDLLGKDEKDAYARSIIQNTRALEDQAARPSGTRAELQERYDRVNSTGKAMSEAAARYYKTPIGMLDKLDDYVDKGRKFIAKLFTKAGFTKAAKAITPKTEYLDSLHYRKKR